MVNSIEVTSDVLSRLEQLESEVHVLRAKDEIRDVLARYCRAIDRIDRDLLLSCYHPDAVDKHGSYNGDPEGFADYCQRQLTTLFERTYYSTGTTLIEVDGDTARCESYIFAPKVLVDKTAEGGGQMWIGAARFLDRFERRDGAWKIAERELIGEWSFIAPMQTESVGPYTVPPNPSVPTGKRDRTDISYGFWA